MRVAMIAALASNRVIGRDNTLPWHLSGDLKYFKRITMGKPLLMGRKTYESIGRPLPGRTNIVLSRQEGFSPLGVQSVSTLPQALHLAEAEQAVELMVIGGEAIYREMLPMAHRLYLTEVHGAVEGDAWFPALEMDQWKEVSREDIDQGEGDDYSYSFVVLDRRSRG